MSRVQRALNLCAILIQCKNSLRNIANKPIDRVQQFITSDSTHARHRPMMGCDLVKFKNLFGRVKFKLDNSKEIHARLTSLISCADNAPGRSCLFASTNSVAPAKRSSSRRMLSSSRQASIRIRSAASTTQTSPSVLSK